MILKRKKSPPLVKKISNYVWPSMGWKRFFTYLKKRIIRLSDSPHNIALGFGIGLACSFNPYMGTHILQAALISWIFGVNIAASAIGTILGNPSTFPFFWWAALATGEALLSIFGFSMPVEITHSTDFEALLAAAKDDPLRILLPWTLGAYVVGVATLPISYFIMRPVIKGTKAARQKIIDARKAYLQKKQQAKDKE